MTRHRAVISSPWLRAHAQQHGGQLGVAEDTFEADAILTAMGPTYLWPQLQTLRGARRSLLDLGLSPEAVLDLVAVKPLQAEEQRLCEAYRAALLPLHARLRPAPSK